MSNHPAPSPFVGRDAELARLQAAWEPVTAGEPRFLVWTADTGLGKTRLVQAFYEWLSTERDARDPDGYWPDALSISGRTLEVNPEFTPTGGPRPDIPWLWWGLRFTDSRYERGIAASTCGLSNARGHLEPHLEPVVRARRGREVTARLAKANAGIWGGLLTGGAANAVVDGLSVFELNRERRGLAAPLPGIGEQQQGQRRDAVEELLALYRTALAAALPGVTDEQAPARLARVGGNPGFLVDLIGYARTTPGTFEHDDPSAALTPEGLQDLLETSE